MNKNFYQTECKNAIKILDKAKSFNAFTNFVISAEKLADETGKPSLVFFKTIGSKRPNGHRVIRYAIGFIQNEKAVELRTWVTNSNSTDSDAYELRCAGFKGFVCQEWCADSRTITARIQL